MKEKIEKEIENLMVDIEFDVGIPLSKEQKGTIEYRIRDFISANSWEIFIDYEDFELMSPAEITATKWEKIGDCIVVPLGTDILSFDGNRAYIAREQEKESKK